MVIFKIFPNFTVVFFGEGFPESRLQFSTELFSSFSFPNQCQSAFWQKVVQSACKLIGSHRTTTNPTTHHQSTHWQLWQVTSYLSSSQAPTCRLNPKYETEDYGCVRNEKFDSVKKFLVRIFAYSLFGGKFSIWK